MNTFSPNTYYPGQKLTRSNEAGWSFEYLLISREGDICTLELTGVFDGDGNRQFSLDNTIIRIPTESLTEFQIINISCVPQSVSGRSSLMRRIFGIMHGSPLPQ